MTYKFEQLHDFPDVLRPSVTRWETIQDNFPDISAAHRFASYWFWKGSYDVWNYTRNDRGVDFITTRHKQVFRFAINRSRSHTLASLLAMPSPRPARS